MLELKLGELVLEQLRDSLPPQTAGGQDVGVVETPDLGRGVLRQSQVSRQTSDALDLGLAVGLRVQGEAGPVVLRSPKYMPPVSSRTTTKSAPRQTSALRGDLSTRESEPKLQGLRFPQVPSSLRRARIPCSGRTGEEGPHSGPPMAPRRTALAFFAALRVSSVRGLT